MLAQPGELFWWDSTKVIPSRGENLSPLAFIEIVQNLYRRVRANVVVSTDHPRGENFQLPHISLRLMRRSTSQDGKTPKTRITLDNGTQIQGQRFNHTFRAYIHGETYAQAEMEAQIFEHTVRDYRGWLFEMGVKGLAFDGGGADTLLMDGGQETPSTYRDYQVILEELRTISNPKIGTIYLNNYSEWRQTTDWITIANVSPVREKQELTFPPIWVIGVTQGVYYFVEGVDYLVRPWGIEWVESVPLPYSVVYLYADQRTLEITV